MEQATCLEVPMVVGENMENTELCNICHRRPRKDGRKCCDTCLTRARLHQKPLNDKWNPIWPLIRKELDAAGVSVRTACGSISVEEKNYPNIEINGTPFAEWKEKFTEKNQWIAENTSSIKITKQVELLGLGPILSLPGSTSKGVGGKRTNHERPMGKQAANDQNEKEAYNRLCAYDRDLRVEWSKVKFEEGSDFQRFSPDGTLFDCWDHKSSERDTFSNAQYKRIEQAKKEGKPYGVIIVSKGRLKGHLYVVPEDFERSGWCLSAGAKEKAMTKVTQNI